MVEVDKEELVELKLVLLTELDVELMLELVELKLLEVELMEVDWLVLDWDVLLVLVLD